MNALNWVELLASATGFVVAIVVTLFSRFGPASWTLGLFLLSGSLSAGILGFGPAMGWSISQRGLLCLETLVFCGVAGCLASCSVGRRDYVGQLKTKRWSSTAIVVTAPILVAGLYLYSPLAAEHALIPLGRVGYATALYLTLVSVIALANIEQTLRCTEDHVRWEIKFLWLGMASSFAALVYVASQILVYPPEYAYLPIEAVRLFPIMFLCSCLLILQSWRRGTARGQLVISQGVVYSTITLTSVGAYLIAASVVSGWASQWREVGVSTEAVVFLLSLVMLSTLFLATAFRHRVRIWIRRNLFAGRYDYRQLWLSATEQIRTSQSIEGAAESLIRLVQSAIASMNVSVWVQVRSTDSLRLVASRGSITDKLPLEVTGLADQAGALVEPVSITDAAAQVVNKKNADFVTMTKASMLVPLISSDRFIGLMTIGADRSGKPFDWQTREFLGVIAVHFANEFHKTELRSRLVEAREAQAFQTFATFLLHDLKNFATTLSLIAKNAARHHDNPDFQADAFESIVALSEKMKRLCCNLRIFSTSLAANKSLGNVNEIVSSVADTLEASPGRRLQLNLDPVPLLVLDREEIVRVLHNVILNAIEASPEDGVVQVNTRSEVRNVVITISDRGHGMSAEFIEKGLFQPFQTTKRDGLGIGLFQSRKIIEAHGGMIEIQSVAGKGTVVRIILPIEDSDTGGKSNPDHQGQVEPTVSRRVNVRLNSNPAPSHYRNCERSHRTFTQATYEYQRRAA
jgi:putative PEP-CTERM system histidine kinase